MNFHEGQKVVCVNDSANPLGISRGLGWNFPDGFPLNGEVYVIREIRLSRCPYAPTGTVGLVLVGMRCLCGNTGRDIGFNPSRFRPLDEMKKEASERLKFEQPV